MARIDKTPRMTSNTAPAPYVVSAISVIASCEPWLAFNGTNIGNLDCWHSGNVATPSKDTPIWIQIDFGAKTLINEITFICRNEVSSNGQYPNQLMILGSDNGTSWTRIKEDINVVGAQAAQITILIGECNYRYYRVCSTSLSNMGQGYVAIGELKFIYDDVNKIATFKINKTLKADLPTTVVNPANNCEMHITEDGGIHISKKDGTLMSCGVTKTELDEVKQSVSSGKTLIAAAITDKGVSASGNDTFLQLSNKINNIQGGSSNCNHGYIKIVNSTFPNYDAVDIIGLFEIITITEREVTT